MKILLLDIETAPNTAHVWGLFKQNVSVNQLLESSYVLCWSAKWYGKREVFFDSVYKSYPEDMLRGIHELLDEAEAVVHYNGSRFDIPTLNKEFILHGMVPPAPYKQMDLLKVSRSVFKFPSNRLDYVASALKVGEKSKHEGHTMWIKCMNNDPAAWAQMEKYNKKDVLLLEKVYDKLKPWIKNHANHNLYTEGKKVVCPNCGSSNHQKRGFHYTSSCKYQRHQCNKCHNWFRSGKSLAPLPDKKGMNLT